MSVNGEVWRILTDSPDILEGIANGKYNIFGGVIRHVAGSSTGGQIVAHLKFPSDQQQTQQSIEKLQGMLNQGFSSTQAAMGQLQQTMNVLQGLQVANLALSGLNLAVSVAGFVIVCKKLNSLSSQIQAQSKNITQILEIVGEARDRALLGDEARFRALVLSAQQFCEMGDTEHLKSILLPIIHEYEFTKLILQKHSVLATSSIDRLNEITLLQERFIHIGLLRSHAQMKIGAVKYAEDALHDLISELSSLNATRVKTLAQDKDLASRMPATHLSKIVAFLEHGKKIVPALSYEADLLALELHQPGTLQLVPNDSSEILVITKN